MERILNVMFHSSQNLCRTRLGRTNGEKGTSSYYRARYYDPAPGRFLSEDPLGFTASPNFYHYVRNRPLFFRDPWGKSPCCVPFALKYAAYGAAGGAGLAALGSVAVDAATGGFNILATPSEIGLGAAAGGAIGYGAGSLVDILLGTSCSASPRSNPFRGNPGEVSTTRRPDGTPKQVRRYGPDGYPDTDVDHDDHGGNRNPHAHDWGRPPDGSPPTDVDRADPGRPVTPGDSRPN
jgi:RHS repeat-associated protein